MDLQRRIARARQNPHLFATRRTAATLVFSLDSPSDGCRILEFCN
jgi:hypothetical protein